MRSHSNQETLIFYIVVNARDLLNETIENMEVGLFSFWRKMWHLNDLSSI